MAKGYWIARMDVADTERYKDYIRTAAPAFQKFDAKFLVRGGRCDALEGKGRARNVVIEFASYEAALDCYNSPAYTQARAIRQSVAEGDLLIVEGNDG